MCVVPIKIGASSASEGVLSERMTRDWFQKFYSGNEMLEGQPL